MIHDPSERLQSDRALTDVGVSIDIAAERGLRIVDVHTRKPIETDRGIKLIECAIDAVSLVNGIAGREYVTRIQTDGETLIAAEATDDAPQLLEPPSDGRALPSARFEQQTRPTISIGQDTGEASDDSVLRQGIRILAGAAKVDDDTGRADGVSPFEVCAHRRYRPFDSHFDEGREVQEVDTVDEDWVDVGGRNSVRKGRQIGRRRTRRSPLLWRGGKHLDALGADLTGASDRDGDAAAAVRADPGTSGH